MCVNIFVNADNIVFVNAWNEWSEGAHLEPDRRFGFAYLQATADAIRNVLHSEFINLNGRTGCENQIIKLHDTAVVLHIFYTDLWEEVVEYLKNLENDFDLFISMPDVLMDFKDTIFQKYPDELMFFSSLLEMDEPAAH